jgi:hypothetical protein
MAAYIVCSVHNIFHMPITSDSSVTANNPNAKETCTQQPWYSTFKEKNQP